MVISIDAETKFTITYGKYSLQTGHRRNFLTYEMPVANITL